MSGRVPPAFRKLLGLAAAPGRTLSALEPGPEVRPDLAPDVGGVEDAVLERLASLVAPASVARQLERVLARLGPDEAGGGGAAHEATPRARAASGLDVGIPLPASDSSAPEPGRPVVGAKRPRVPAPSRRAGGATVEAPPPRQVDSRRLEELAGLDGVAPPVEPGPRVTSREERRLATGTPGKARRTGPGDVGGRNVHSTGAPSDILSREEVRERLHQRAERAGAAAALETPVVPVAAPREVSEVLTRSVAALEPARGQEPGPAAQPASPSTLTRPIERALERLESRPSARALPSEPARPAPRAHGPEVPAPGPARARAEEEPRGGLAGLAARAAQAAAPAPRARTESHPPPPLLASPALPEPAIPSVLAERMEETKLTQRLERLLRREAERAGVSLEGLDP